MAPGNLALGNPRGWRDAPGLPAPQFPAVRAADGFSRQELQPRLAA